MAQPRRGKGLFQLFQLRNAGMQADPLQAFLGSPAVLETIDFNEAKGLRRFKRRFKRLPRDIREMVLRDPLLCLLTRIGLPHKKLRRRFYELLGYDA